jgi:hypothetical protein
MNLDFIIDIASSLNIIYSLFNKSAWRFLLITHIFSISLD